VLVFEKSIIYLLSALMTEDYENNVP